jgi:hypothetical protein
LHPIQQKEIEGVLLRKQKAITGLGGVSIFANPE